MALYPADPGSPYTTLAAPYTTGDVSIVLTDASDRPPAPNIICLEGPPGAAVCTYTGIDGNTLVGVEQIEGPTATWPAGSYAFRGFTATDHNAIIESIEDINAVISGLNTTISEDLEALSATVAAHVHSTANPHRVTASQVGNAAPQWNANKIQGRPVSTTGIADKKILQYDVNTDSLVWTNQDGLLTSPAWNERGELAAGNGPGEGVIIPPGTDGQILTANSLYPGGLRWESISNITGVGNDLLWDAKGDIAVGIGINKATRLPVGSLNQVLAADPTTLTGLKWVSPAALLDSIWGEAGAGALIARHYHPTPPNGGYYYYAPIPIGNDGDVLTVDSSQEGRMSWQPLADIFSVADDQIWGAGKGQLVVGVGPRTAIAIAPAGNNLVLLSDDTTESGYRWVELQTLNGIAADAIWSAKNDLLIGTGNPVTDRAKVLPVGADQQILRVVPKYDEKGVRTGADVEWSDERTIADDPIWTGCAEGDIIIGMRSYPSQGTPSYWGARLPVGQNGQVLTVDTSVSGRLVWKYLEEVFNIANDALWQDAGDLAVGTGAGSATRLPRGAAGSVLTTDGSTVVWQLPKNPKDPDVLAENAFWASYPAGTLIIANGDGTATALQPGAPGKVLTANDNDPRGISWSDPQAGPGIRADIAWTAKGQLISGRGPGSAEVVPVGEDGKILVANSETESGLDWKTEFQIANDPIWQGCNYGDLVFGARNFPSKGSPSYWGARLPIGQNGQILTVKRTNNQSGPNWNYLAWDYINFDILSTDVWGAKGDLLVGAGAAQAGRLPAGATGTVLVADNAAPYGVRWARVEDVTGIGYDDIWEEKGDIAVGIYENRATLLKKGAQNQVLTVDNTTETGYAWKTLPTLANDPLWFARGDLVVGTGEAQAARLARPDDVTYGKVLITDPTAQVGLAWADPRHIVSVKNDNLWDARGDLAVGSDIDTCDRLPVGRPGQVLMVDDEAPLGLAWADLQGLPTDGEDGQLLIADSRSPGGVKWISPNLWTQNIYLSGAGCIPSETNGCNAPAAKAIGGITYVVPEFPETATDPGGEWDITLPDSWLGRKIMFRVAWFCDNGQENDVQWVLQGRRIAAGGSLSGAMGYIGSVRSTNAGAALVNISEFSSPALIPGEGNHVHLKLIRQTSNENDTLAYPAFLLGVLIETYEGEVLL